MTPEIRDKAEFKRLQMAGRLGNYFRMWSSVEEMHASGHEGWLTVRARRASDRKLFIPEIFCWDVAGVGADLHIYAPRKKGPLAAYSIYSWKRHCRMADIYLQECPAPDTGRLINMEAVPGFAGGSALDACANIRFALNDPTNLRHSLEQNGQDATGLKALATMRHYLGEDYEQLQDIWDRYPGAVIEASRFARRVGVFNSQLIIWEVRHF